MVHLAMRKQLRGEGWTLLAGQFPGGSDDELPPLQVVDPVLARDLSPDPRRHGLGKLVPDLVALRESTILLVEAKVGYSDEDRVKLLELIGPRRDDLLRALAKFAADRDVPELAFPENLRIVPAMAQSAERSFPGLPDGFASIRALALNRALITMPDNLEGAA